MVTLDAAKILTDITEQGNKVRDLKAAKAAKGDVDAAVKILLNLKAQYKAATGQEWKPGAAPPPQPTSSQTGTPSGSDLLEKISKQGDLVRSLKEKKAGKAEIDAGVKVLKDLKAEYKAVTGEEWKPATSQPVSAPIPTASAPVDASSLNGKLTTQADHVRTLKNKKAPKSTVDAEVKTLLDLKKQFKDLTGQDWKAGSPPKTTEVKTQAPSAPSCDVNKLSVDLTDQANHVRNLKGQKAPKAAVDAAVKVLLDLKAEYKAATGTEWKAATPPEPNQPVKTPVVRDTVQAPTVMASQEKKPESDEKDALTAKITAQGDIVRNLKSSKASKADIDAAVKILQDLKGEYKKVTGIEFPSGNRNQGNRSFHHRRPPSKPKSKESSPVQEEPSVGGMKKVTRLCLEAKKEENLPDWYSQVITKGELIEYYDVSGCYILRHWSFAVWKAIKNWFDAEITNLGVKECYFPIFVSRSVLEKEKTHIADFAPEVAWVTKSGDSDLAEPIAIRPTSETVMYPAYAKWIQSHRDLPLRLNQWNNVVRWEFKHPQPFLRTREFLWQEGHTAFQTAKEAKDEVYQILDLYARVYTDLLAIPVVKGRKTEKEKFAGGDFTTTVEAFISASGRAIQGATSHHLGQNFSKMFEIAFEDPETKLKEYVYQNSWGITTRTIGVMIMVHADNQGLVLPPRVACIQVIIVPCGMTASMPEEEKNALQASCKELENELRKDGLRAEGDYRDNYSAGWKFNHWELKGVPIRIELGPKDLLNQQFVAVRRDTGEKISVKRDNACRELPLLLFDIHQNMLARATKDLEDHKKLTRNWQEFVKLLDAKNIILSPFCGNSECEDKIKADSQRENAQFVEPGAPSMGAKSLCIPFEQPEQLLATDKCIHPECSRKPMAFTLFGRSY
ncbi:hypothetical protein DMENIID0001_018490 [Sergentomyia squamirostris]